MVMQCSSTIPNENTLHFSKLSRRFLYLNQPRTYLLAISLSSSGE